MKTVALVSSLLVFFSVGSFASQENLLETFVNQQLDLLSKQKEGILEAVASQELSPELCNYFVDNFNSNYVNSQKVIIAITEISEQENRELVASLWSRLREIDLIDSEICPQD